MMKIACDNFNHKLLAFSKLKPTPVYNFRTCNDIFDVVVAGWQPIHTYLRKNETKLKNSLFVVSQYSDASHNRRIAGSVNTYNKLNNTNNQLIVIGDGVSHYSNTINSPWSRFFWMHNNGYLSPWEEKTHWTCLMSRQDIHRDQVEDFFKSNIEMFDLPNDYVYDGTASLDTMQKYMFRKVLDKRYYHKNSSTWETATNLNWTDGDLITPYHRSKIELVTETLTDFFFVTEKTVKPIRAGIPFVIVGGHHFLKRLQQMGFKTFSPWIDESYDKEQDTHKRVQQACVSFKDFVYSKNINHDEIARICYHNQQRLKKIVSLFPKWQRRQVKKIEYFVNQYANNLS